MSEFSIIISRTEYAHVFVEADDFLYAQDIAGEMVENNSLKFEIHPESYNYNIKEIDDISS